jgi:hypothetical protein
MAPPDVIDMNTREVTGVGHRLGAIAAMLQADWPTLRQRIAVAENGIRADKLGTQYRVEYGPAADAIRRKADAVPGQYQKLATQATTAAAMYEQADQAAANGFPR